MAEFVVLSVVEKLTNWITQEAVILTGVSDKVEQLRDDLRWMQSFLIDAEAEQEKNERFRIWVSQISEVAQHAEDVIESYIADAASHSSWNLAAKLISRRRKVGKEIERIRSRVQNISSQKEHFGISSTSQDRREERENHTAKERLRWWRQPPPNIMKDDDLVGLVEDTKALIAQLSSMDQCRRVVSIVGMGGLGKTTLAKRLYNHIDSKNEFDCKSFVYISQEYNRRGTLQRIIKDTSHSPIEGLEKLEEDELVTKLHKVLEERKYLVVLDDIWEKHVWESMEAAFPSGKMGSKVMLTSRKREVALHADPRSIPHEPRLLTDDESLELFRKKALPGADHLPSDLDKIGREMVAKCGGLPLAVVVLGGLVSTKTKTAEEWRRMLQSIRLIGEDRVSAILALSYNDLPFNLKSCFLHMGIFPEDYSIPKTKLMRIWVAEGFLPQQQGVGEEAAEDVAENCLNELINRCLIQVGTLTGYGWVKTLRMHDLLRDLCVSKGKEESFLAVYTGRQVTSSSPAFQSPKPRRLAIHVHSDWYAFLKPYAPHVRSLQFFSQGGHRDVDFNCKSFKLLRVLEIPYVIPVAPRALGSLRQLRYLELNLKDGKRIPRSIGKLKNLQTLKLLGTSLGIHRVIPKLKNLRHLQLTHFYFKKFKMDTLSHLQTLKGLDGGRWIEKCGLASLTNLRQLAIRHLTADVLNLVFSIVERLRYLQSLTVFVFDSLSFPTPMRLSNCENLLKLRLKGRFEKLPFPHEFPPNLVKLSLSYTKLQQDSVEILEKLPNLKMLFLGSQSYLCQKLVCSSESFPQLRTLHLDCLQTLEELMVEEGGMMELQNLKITKCYRLHKIPERLKLLITYES